jgi:hypothetical protein
LAGDILWRVEEGHKLWVKKRERVKAVLGREDVHFTSV